MTIYDLVVSNEIATYWDTIKSGEAPYLGETLFPNQKKLGLDLSWIKGKNGLPVSLKLSAFDAKALKRDRIGFSEVKTKMPFFKESMSVDEELRQKLNMVMESGKKSVRNIILNQIFNDEMTLLRGAEVVRERMRMQLLTTGKIVMANNGQEYTYDYGLEEGQKVTAQTKWTDFDNSDPVTDINTWADAREEVTGVRPTRAICSRRVLNLLAQNKKIKNAIYVFAGGNVTLTNDSVISYIENATKIKIAVYEKQYIDDDGKAKKFIPKDLFIMIPEGNLGSTWFGTTPEESDLMSSPNVANVSIVDMGVAITTTKETDPVNVDTKVSQICLPSFEQSDKIVIADVSDEVDTMSAMAMNTMSVNEPKAASTSTKSTSSK